MIVSKDVKLKLGFPITNKQIESALQNLGFNILRWSIVDVSEDTYTIRVSIIS